MTKPTRTRRTRTRKPADPKAPGRVNVPKHDPNKRHAPSRETAGGPPGRFRLDPEAGARSTTSQAPRFSRPNRIIRAGLLRQIATAMTTAAALPPTLQQRMIREAGRLLRAWHRRLHAEYPTLRPLKGRP